jgi:CheY-like chemotaxis protein
VTAAPRPLRIFVVENDEDTRRVLTMYLARKGYVVDGAASLGETVERLRVRQADVLLADIGLPDGNGWELLDRLRADKLPVPPYAIAMTGFGRSDDFDKSRAAGFRHHLVKPFDTAKLLAILDEAAGEAGSAA